MEDIEFIMETPAKNLSELETGKYEVTCVKPTVTKYGDTYVFLCGKEVYFANNYLKKVIRDIPEDYRQKDLIYNKGAPLGILFILPGKKNGKYNKRLRFKHFK